MIDWLISRMARSGRLQEWLTREVRRMTETEVRRVIETELPAAVDTEVRKVRVLYLDPLVVFQQNRESIAAQLRAAVNVAGQDVMVGQEVVLCGGRFPGGLGIELHDNVRLYDHCRLVVDQIEPASGIVLEERVSLNFGSYIDGSGGVRIRKRSILGPHVVIVSSAHRLVPGVPVQQSGKDFQSVDIGEDVWVGASAVIRMGVTIGDGAVIGAGSIVTHDVPAGAVFAGNPARSLR